MRAVILCAALSLTTISGLKARADVRVQGGAPAIEIAFSQARISEILTALAASYPLRFRTSVALDDVIDGKCNGSLEQVLARVLEGYNYVIKNDPTVMELIVYGRRGERAIPVNVPPPPAPRNPATDWGQSRKR